MGESSDGENGVFQGPSTMLGNVSAVELHYVESSALLLMLLVLVMLIGAGQGDTRLLSSNVEPCRQDGGSELELKCLTKILLQLSIVHGKSIQSDTMETFVTHVKESGGASKALDVPYRITIYKSDIYAQYPITYLQSFNENPHEVVISSPDCRDGHNGHSPSWGWPYNNDGERVKDSQGFCCLCNITESLSDGQGKRQSLRMVEEDCNITLSTRRSFPWRRSGSAHCLQFSKKRYPTYQLGKPLFSISVRVVVEMMHLKPGQVYGSQDINSKTLYFNHQQITLKVYQNESLKAHLQGDFDFNMQVPLLQDQYLSIPLEEGKSEKVSHVDQWLILPKDYFTLDGKECDKIGVSYNAFKFQANACDQPLQSCCGNQINAFAQEDSQRMLAGEAPKYNFLQYGKVVVQDGIPLEPTTLNLHIDKEQVSVLTVELQPDDLQYYKDRSTGKILKADVARFETGTRRVLLLVEVVNMGMIHSYFKIKVVDCTAIVDIIPAEIITLLVPAIPSSFWLNLRIREHVHSLNSNTISCKVVLFENLQEMSKEVEKLIEIPLHGKPIPQHVSEPAGMKLQNKSSSWCFIFCGDSDQYKKPPPPPPRIDPCLGNCTKIFDYKCFIKNWCWQQFLKMIGVILAIIVGLFLVFLLFQSGVMSLICECLTVVVCKTTKKAAKVGKKVAIAQRKREKIRTRAALKEGKEMARTEFLREKFMDEEDEQFDKIVLGVKKGKKEPNKGNKNEGKKSPNKGGKKGQKAKQEGKNKGKKGKSKKRKSRKKREHGRDSDDRRKKKKAGHSESEEDSGSGSGDDRTEDESD